MRRLGTLEMLAAALILAGATDQVRAQSCPGDLDGNSKVTVDELVTSVNSALTGCPTPLTNLPIVGSWFGSYATHGLAVGVGTQTLTIRSDGTADLNVSGQPFHLQLTVLNAQRRVYGLRRTEDELTGALQVSADGRYAVYIDEYGAFGVLQRGASALAPSYSAADLVDLNVFIGFLPFDYFFGTAITYGPASGLGGGHAAFTISDVSSSLGLMYGAPGVPPYFFFVLVSHRLSAGSGDTQTVTISSDAGIAALGVFTGGWSGNDAAGNQLSGNATFIMSPDKNFLATEICFGDFPADCQYSDWERQAGSYAAACKYCDAGLNTADQGVLMCLCPDDQAVFGQTSLPLPCVGGSLVNENGALTCRGAPPVPRLVDNGDGTVTDNQTGLMWEKKDNPDSSPSATDPHDVDNDYTWSHTGSAPDGTAFTDFLKALNGGAAGCTSTDGTTQMGGFAGHCDWRLPTIAELKSILDTTQGACGGGSSTDPCIDPVFGPTKADGHWSSTTSFSSDEAWAVSFFNGQASSNTLKIYQTYVRAVRGGL